MSNGFLTEINDYGALSSRPAASAALEGYNYHASDEGITYRCNGSSWDEVGINTAAHADIDHTGIPGITAGTGFSGKPIAVPPVGAALAISNDASPPTNNTAQMARAVPIIIPAAMKIRALWLRVSAAGTGALQWGLFDLGSTLTAATKVAGGSAAPGGTGWISIAASGAPADVAFGSYMLILFNPATNQTTYHYCNAGSAPGIYKAWTTFTWSDTPNLTSGSWSDSSVCPMMYLEGDMDGSGTRW